jgi:hypothetical protein
MALVLPSGRKPVLETQVIAVARKEPSRVLDKAGVLDEAGVRVMALGVPHATMRSLVYRIDSTRTSVVFGSDQTGTNPKLIELAKNADVLVLHLAIGTGMTSPFQAAPDVVGRVAHDAAARSLVLSHIGQFAIDAAVAEVKKSYVGPITVATDLQYVSTAARRGAARRREWAQEWPQSATLNKTPAGRSRPAAADLPRIGHNREPSAGRVGA